MMSSESIASSTREFIGQISGALVTALRMAIAALLVTLPFV